MKIHRHIFSAALILLPFIASARVTENFDASWSFLQTDTAGAEINNFDDSTWQKISVPHDWSIAGPFSETNKTGGAGGFLPSGVGWYRKHFTLPATDSGKSISIEFDGVMQNSDVWINGFHLGHRPNGYVSFSYDLTGHLNFGGDNVLAVRADTSAQPASRWYSGAGIYRHVRLVVTDPIHFLQNGIFISTPQVSETNATVKIESAVTNYFDGTRSVILMPEQKISLEISLLDANGQIVGAAKTIPQSILIGGGAHFSQDISLKNPQLWSLDSPNLYRAVSKIIFGEKVLDEATNTFGIRDAHFEADTGFWLNGKNFKIYGVCLHHEGGAFGAAVPLSIWEARLTALKSLGVNAIRTAHNPPAPEFLDLCDRMGFLVMDESFDCWTRGKTASDYHLFFSKWSHTDERDAILRDRNHPSVIIYSVGNEILDTPNAEKAKQILTSLVAVAHAADPTRPVTQALFRPNKSGDYTNGLADLLDVIGTNYRDTELLAAQRAKPERKIINTEQKHTREAWLSLRDNPSLAGQFLWVGVDYLGEARAWPRISYAGGLLDRTGLVKPSARERQSWWSDQPMVRVVRRTAANDPMPGDPGYGEKEMFTQVQFTDWTPKNLSPHNENIEVYSNGKEVELFLNGKSLGAKEINADASPRNWSVPFAPGILQAVARGENGKMAATNELQTAGKPAKIILSTETQTLVSGFDRVAIVRAKIVDKNGIQIPHANDLISFQISGAGEIAAVDNGDNDSHELFQANSRHAFQGECVAFVKATAAGEIKVSATAAGLAAGTLSINPQK